MQQSRTLAFKDAPAHWDIQRILGRGSYGDVRKCIINGIDYAVKAQKLGRRADDTLAKQIVVEHDIGTAAPEDSALVRVMGVEIKNAMAFIVMPCYGQTLASMLKGITSFCESDIAHIAADLGSALAALHDAGIIHRDVKPANIMTHLASPLGRSCYVLGDYGVSNVVSVASTCIGTPYTMAPEINSAGPYGPSIDIWGAGCCLYEAFFGRAPFKGSSQRQLRMRIARGLTDVQIANLRAKIPSMGPLVSKCLSIQEVRRPTAEVLSDSAHAHLKTMGQPISVANRQLEVNSSNIIARMRRTLPGSLRRMCRSPPPPPSSPSSPSPPIISQRLPPVRQPPVLSKATSVLPPIDNCVRKVAEPHRRRRWDDVVSVYQKPMQLFDVCSAISHRTGRTHDFDAAKHYGNRVKGYRYLGKVYVTHVSPG